MSIATTTLNGFGSQLNARGDEAVGRCILSVAFGITAQVSAICLAAACSSVWIAMLVWFIGGFVLGLLAYLINCYVQGAVAPERFASAGQAVGATIGRARRLFNRA